MKALLAALAILLLAVVPAAEAAGAKRPARVTCHWVKATKKHRRHKVCVKVKAKSKTTKKPASSTPSAKRPAASTPGASTSAGTATTPAAAATPAAPTPAVDPTTSPAVVAPPTTPPTSDPAPAPLTRLQTTAREWSLTLSRPTIAAGALSLQLVNAGEDAHDLHVRPAAGGADLLSATTTASGATTTISGSLLAGTYTLYCSLPGHEAAGMHATLTVTP
ncbi:plastocyanin/azurin family copper-binding protein [Conexibacter woesei]|uniref:plastocyanin/azurin family copper-binding protein n=1 Tax=Conexibacter woesei TaxID=191495 RepID=UPI0004788BD7|nr:plastocyanin/azurin family copper-binding protein [Conexibacter woesei]